MKNIKIIKVIKKYVYEIFEPEIVNFMKLLVNKMTFNSDLKGKKIKITFKNGNVQYSIVKGYYVYNDTILSLETFKFSDINLLYIQHVDTKYNIEVIDEFPSCMDETIDKYNKMLKIVY